MRILKIAGIIVCLFLLVLVRKFETVLFYDPLLSFFKTVNFNHLDVPPFDSAKLILSLFFRYALNAILTLSIVYLWFGDKKVIRLAFWILTAGFVLFGAIYFFSLHTHFSIGYMPTFYIRRFLIQPIFLLLLIPAIYWKNKTRNFN
ncbi:MAG: exosortase F system-associated protein [Flavobacteriaceae bacterium]|jgi:exosortase F-associated protein|nr:exosortase F system-associated protein [Flavobacteriaceae bacterium]